MVLANLEESIPPFNLLPVRGIRGGVDDIILPCLERFLITYAGLKKNPAKSINNTKKDCVAETKPHMFETCTGEDYEYYYFHREEWVSILESPANGLQ